LVAWSLTGSVLVVLAAASVLLGLNASRQGGPPVQPRPL
jgi:hypothetical protein